MRPPSPAAEALATRLAAAASARQSGGADRSALAAREHALAQLADTLERWFGAFGYHALLVRALTHARREHPALATVTTGDPLAPTLAGFEQAVAAHGVEAATAGAHAVLTAVLALLGRVVGDDMILYLVEPRMNATSTAEPAPSAQPPASARASAPIAEPRAGAEPRPS